MYKCDTLKKRVVACENSASSPEREIGFENVIYLKIKKKKTETFHFQSFCGPQIVKLSTSFYQNNLYSSGVARGFVARQVLKISGHYTVIIHSLF